MNAVNVPDTMTKLAALGEATRFEPAGDQPERERAAGARGRPHSLADCITQVSTPTGHKPILKGMMTTACERNCYYCPFRAGRTRTPRVNFTPDEMARGFETLERAGRVDGIFLSSGILRGSVTTQDKLLDTAEIIRGRLAYQGYVHLKIMPGIERDQLFRAMQLADRVSVNLEAPTQARLDVLAPKKDWAGELLRTLEWATAIRHAHPTLKLASTVTQFVVGAAGETDAELLHLGERLYRGLGLKRTYYQAFHPVAQTPFEELLPTDPRREFRLYQASFLLRDYGWTAAELPFDAGGNLALDVDPKRAMGDHILREAPVELMTADRATLLRVPGIGPAGADAILRARRERRLTDLAQLRGLGVRAPERVAPYVLLSGHAPATQLRLF